MSGVGKPVVVVVEIPVAIWGHCMEVAEEGFDTGEASEIHSAEKENVDAVEIEISLVSSATRHTVRILQEAVKWDNDSELVFHAVNTVKQSSQNLENISAHYIVP